MSRKPETLRAVGLAAGRLRGALDAAEMVTDGACIGSLGRLRSAPAGKDAHRDLLATFDRPELIGLLSIADGAALAEASGVPVVSGFGEDDRQFGGLGEPMTPFFLHACARYIGADAPLCLLDLGSDATLTWADPRRAAPEEAGALLAFGAGPANDALDALVRGRTGHPFDRDGALARQGRVADGALELFLDDAYFARIPPKLPEPDRFAVMLDLVAEMDAPDAAATLTAMIAVAIMRGLEHCPEPPTRILVAGGGRHNPVLMEMLRAGIDCPVQPAEAAALDGDALDAQAAAHLAVRVMRGLPTSCPGTTGVAAAIGGGTIARP